MIALEAVPTGDYILTETFTPQGTCRRRIYPPRYRRGDAAADDSQSDWRHVVIHKTDERRRTARRFRPRCTVSSLDSRRKR